MAAGVRAILKHMQSPAVDVAPDTAPGTRAIGWIGRRRCPKLAIPGRRAAPIPGSLGRRALESGHRHAGGHGGLRLLRAIVHRHHQLVMLV